MALLVRSFVALAWGTAILGPHHDAAVDAQDRTIDEARLFRCEEEISVRDVARLAHATHGRALDHGLQDRFWHLSHYLGRDETGRDRVDGDPLRPELTRPDLRQADDAGLRRDIVGLPEVAVETHDGRRVEHAAPALFDHHARDGLPAEDHALEIHGDDRVEL